MTGNKKRIVTICCILLSACSVFQAKPTTGISLTKPVRPVLPLIEAEQFECLSNETRSKLSERNLLLRQYAEQLETVIDSVNKK